MVCPWGRSSLCFLGSFWLEWVWWGHQEPASEVVLPFPPSLSLLRVKKHSKEFAGRFFFTPFGCAGADVGSGEVWVCTPPPSSPAGCLGVPKLDKSFPMALSCKALQIPLPRAHLT